MPVLTLDDNQVRDTFITEKSLMKPSVDPTPPPATVGRRGAASQEDQFDAWLESAKQIVSVAQARAAAVASPTNLIRLAQAQYVAGENAEAVESAITAMTDAATLIESGQSEVADLALVFGSGVTLLCHLGRRNDALNLVERIGPAPSLELTYASLLVEAGRLEDALTALTGTEDALADALRGYIYAVDGQTQRAVHFLRQSLRRNPNDAETSMNLATAYWKLGSRRKAIASALRATRLAPSRQDISVAYMELLIDNNQADLVTAETKRLRKAGVMECARLLIVECQAELAKGETKAALTLMRRARSAAVSEGDERLVAEIVANLRVFEASEAGKGRAELWRIARQCVTESPHNVAALRQFAAYSYRRSEAESLREAIAAAGTLPTTTRLHVESKLAYMSCDFGRALELSQQAAEEDTMNAEACAQVLLLEGWHLGAWESAAQRASRWVARLPLNDNLVNNAAYVMALGGLPHAALTVLDRHSHANDDYVPIATRGLAHLAAGDLDEGMFWYRRAAERADRLGEGDMRVLMALHQAAGLRALGIADVTDELFLAATSLPDTGLPADWEDQPAFVMVQKGCEREGWPWPPTVAG